MKLLLLFIPAIMLQILFAQHGGHTSAGKSYATSELPIGGETLQPIKKSSLYFYLPKVYEVFELKNEWIKLKSDNRSRYAASTGIFYSKDGEKWHMGGGNLQFASLWTHPRTGVYYATLINNEYATIKGKLYSKILCHIAMSTDGNDWTLIQGDLRTSEDFPHFIMDPLNNDKVCLFYRGKDVVGKRWSVAQAEGNSYSVWKLYNHREWQHGNPTKKNHNNTTRRMKSKWLIK